MTKSEIWRNLPLIPSIVTLLRFPFFLINTIYRCGPLGNGSGRGTAFPDFDLTEWPFLLQDLDRAIGAPVCVLVRFFFPSIVLLSVNDLDRFL